MLTNADLMAIFNFTEDDLEANRAGRMIARQVERLKHENENIALYGGLVILGVTLVGCCAFFGGPSPRTGAEPNPGLTCLIGIVMIGLLVITLFWLARRTKSDVQQGVVASEERKLTLKMMPTKLGFSYTMQINSKELPISSYAYGVLTDKHRVALEMNSFRLYFAPASKQVLSLESLEAPES